MPKKAKKLLNLATQQLIADECEIAGSPYSRLLGLLGRSNFPEGQALILPHCKCVHMFFMRFAIDVLFCNGQGQILGMAANLKPWKVSPYVPAASFVIELPAGTIEQCNLNCGDRIEIV